MLTVTIAAADRTLLTLAEIRAAVGVTDGSYATELADLNARVAEAITNECGVEPAGSSLPTLREESLTQTWRAVCSKSCLWLARAPVSSIASVVVDGTTLDAADYEADGWRLIRLDDDAPVVWSGTKIVVSYTAGWATVPHNLKLAAVKLARTLWSEDGPSAMDPGIKRVRTDGVEEIERWVSPATDALLPQEVRDLLRPYINYGV